MVAVSEWLVGYYDWLRVLHILAFIAWMAGLFYLPRLFVYHTRAAVGSEAYELFKVMELKLLRIIMNPAMVASWLFGILLIVAQPAWLMQGWLHGKLLLVVLLTAAHMWMARWRKTFAAGENRRPERFYRYANEIPTVLLIGIVILVVIKPF